MSPSGPLIEPDQAARIALLGAIAARVFPAASVEVGDRRGPIWREAFGALTFDSTAAPATIDTIFDLASLTKPIATTSLVMQLVAKRAVAVDDRVATYFSEWTGTDRAAVTLRDLLEHAAGLPPRLLDAAPESPREFVHDICGTPLEQPPRTKSIYSDLGFILLGCLVEQEGRAQLSDQFAALSRSVGKAVGSMDFLGYDVPADRLADTAPTLPLDEDRRRGRLLQGEVHDNYAAVFRGGAGHAGLFGTADGVGMFARAILRAARADPHGPPALSPALVTAATRRSDVPNSSRGLGWDTMLPTSSCGSQMSPAAFGHTGFTGTSLWIDPGLDRYFVLLTNRVCGGGSSDEMQKVRRAFHDAAAKI